MQPLSSNYSRRKRNHLHTQRVASSNFDGKKKKAQKLLSQVKLTKTFVVSSKYVSLVTHTLETTGYVYTSPICAYISLLLTLINYERQERTFVKFRDKSNRRTKLERDARI